MLLTNGRPQNRLEGLRFMLKHNFNPEYIVFDDHEINPSTIEFLAREFHVDFNKLTYPVCLSSSSSTSCSDSWTTSEPYTHIPETPLLKYSRTGKDEIILSLMHHGASRKGTPLTKPTGERRYPFFIAVQGMLRRPPRRRSLRAIQKLFTTECLAKANISRWPVLAVGEKSLELRTPGRLSLLMILAQSGIFLRANDEMAKEKLAVAVEAVQKGFHNRTCIEQRQKEDEMDYRLSERFQLHEEEHFFVPYPDRQHYIPILAEDFLMDISPSANPETFKCLPDFCQSSVMSLKHQCRRAIRNTN
ncbi:unnamed protein product [Cyprideis torosa]|uniref:Uncharacterized protein n=1 Tax=Cyprideis torosa TaxID=163714 RepID=A0A7R8WC94_9CRUS|nr:unnamed protein product [Cyprideis torosa]CAG0893076.1 unnamed protein product [Cyprideis torosa]